MTDFDGATYDPDFDHARLTSQLDRVRTLMQDGQWRTLREIADKVGDPEASVSARLRDLRKEKFGAWRVERRRRGAPERGLHEYRLLPPVAPVRSLAAESAAVTARADDAEQEVDLRGMRVDEAEMAMLAALDAAVLAAYPLLKVIHGKGTGAVRERVHELVRSDCRVTRFGLAPHNQGGSGVTIVELGG